MTDGRLPGTENMKCAIGLYEGTSEFVEGPLKGQKVHGIFSYANVAEEPCDKPVRFWCKRKGTHHAWLACSDPEHRRDAESVLELTPEYIAFLVWQQKPGQPIPKILEHRAKRDPFLDAPKRLVESTPEAKALPEKKRIPRNKKKLLANHRPTKSSKGEALEKAGKAAAKVFAVVMGLVDKDKG